MADLARDIMALIQEHGNTNQTLILKHLRQLADQADAPRVLGSSLDRTLPILRVPIADRMGASGLVEDGADVEPNMRVATYKLVKEGDA